MNLITVLALLLSMSGCVTAPKPTQSDIIKDSAAKADDLVKQQDFVAAARIYRSLGERTSRAKRGHFQLLAFNTLVKAGHNDEALAYGSKIDEQYLIPQDSQYFALQLAKLKLDNDDIGGAITQLEMISLAGLNRTDKPLYHELKASAYEQNGNLLDAARERVSLEELQTDPQLIDANQTAILNDLLQIRTTELKIRQPPAPDILGGWMNLAYTIKRYPRRSPETDNAIDEWRQQFPNHPAKEAFIFEYLDQRKTPEFPPPSRIAVLLPQQGPFEKAARAIQEGITSAYFSDTGTEKPTIEFYDSSAMDILDIYQQAIDDQADFIIGPLTKENLRILSESENPSVPVLALNTIPDLTAENLYQFGLTPEDEAEQTANSAWLEGHRKAVIFAPATNLGHRLTSHFSTYWEQLGGTILNSQSYPPKDNDFSKNIKALLNLNESESRSFRLKKIVPNIKYEARRRKDIDFIFLVATPRSGRLIRPQLQYFRASHLPVYAISSVYEGQPNPAKDRDLSNIIFCDIPWLLYPNNSDTLTVETIEQNWQPRSGILKRLTALGMDAYELATNLSLLQNPGEQIAGATGNLSLGSDNRIRRQLYCAQFQQGIPSSLGAAPILHPNETEPQSGPFSEDN